MHQPPDAAFYLPNLYITQEVLRHRKHLPAAGADRPGVHSFHKPTAVCGHGPVDRCPTGHRDVFYAAARVSRRQKPAAMALLGPSAALPVCTLISSSLVTRYANGFDCVALQSGKKLMRLVVVGGTSQSEPLNLLTTIATALELFRRSPESTLVQNCRRSHCCDQIQQRCYPRRLCRTGHTGWGCWWPRCRSMLGNLLPVILELSAASDIPCPLTS